MLPECAGYFLRACEPNARLAGDGGAILLEQNNEWAVCRRYMTLETIAKVCRPVREETMLMAAE